MVGPDYDGITDMSQLPEEAFTPQRFQRGDTVEGEVVRIDDEGMVVSVGLKTEGMVPASEMRTLTAEEREDLEAGKRMAFTVMRRERGSDMALLSLDQARRFQVWIDLQNNLNEGDPVTVKVTGYNRGAVWKSISGESAVLSPCPTWLPTPPMAARRTWPPGSVKRPCSTSWNWIPAGNGWSSPSGPFISNAGPRRGGGSWKTWKKGP